MALELIPQADEEGQRGRRPRRRHRASQAHRCQEALDKAASQHLGCHCLTSARGECGHLS